MRECFVYSDPSPSGKRWGGRESMKGETRKRTAWRCLLPSSFVPKGEKGRKEKEETKKGRNGGGKVFYLCPYSY